MRLVLFGVSAMLTISNAIRIDSYETDEQNNSIANLIKMSLGQAKAIDLKDTDHSYVAADQDMEEDYDENDEQLNYIFSLLKQGE